MFCVRDFSFALLAVAAFWSHGLCFDSPVPFGSGVWGAPDGLPGWNSTPARLPATSVGVSGYMRSGDVGEWALSAAGEWQMRCFRGAFLYSFYALDSLYRESGAMLELSVSRWFLVAGVGAGAYADWLPGDAAWVRYRFKAGLSALVSRLTLSMAWFGFTDEFPDYPRAAIHWTPSATFSAFAQTDWESVAVGTLLRFAWGSVETSYVFPGFAFSFGISVEIAGFGIGAKHGSLGSMPDWNGVWVSKKLKK